MSSSAVIDNDLNTVRFQTVQLTHAKFHQVLIAANQCLCVAYNEGGHGLFVNKNRSFQYCIIRIIQVYTKVNEADEPHTSLMDVFSASRT